MKTPSSERRGRAKSMGFILVEVLQRGEVLRREDRVDKICLN